MKDLIEQRLHELRSQKLDRHLEVSCGISFIHNDYLGLSQHPAILEEGRRAIELFGAGSTGSRLLGGHSRIFEDAEESVARFFNAPSALLFSTGYLANLGVIQVLGSLVDTIISDEKNHASLIDGVQLTKRPKLVLPHGAWNKVPAELLEKKLLLVTESLFSMDGDLVLLDKLWRLFETSESFLVLDEAHAGGVLLEEGKGLVQSAHQKDPHCWNRLAVTVTFGKAFGVGGAAILCSRELKELLINQARSFIYTTAPAPALVAMIKASLEVAERENWRRHELWERASSVRAILESANAAREKPIRNHEQGWGRKVPIIPFFITGEDRALRFCENMRKWGAELRAIRYPTVPKGSERIRISLNLSVSRDNTERTAEEMVKQWMAFSLQEPIRA